MNSINTTLPLSTRKQNIARHFSNANDYNQYANVQSNICDLLISKIEHQNQDFVLEIGAGQGQLTEKLSKHIIADSWHVNELCIAHEETLQGIIPQANIYITDGESLALSDSFSLIVSANAVQWFDQPLSFISQSDKALQADGQLLFNTFTPNNFKQIKQLTGQGLDYPSLEQWEFQLKKNNFDIIEISTHLYELSFDSPLAVLKHIKQTGVSVNTDNLFHWTKSSLTKFVNEYEKLFSNQIDSKIETGKVVLSYEALLINAIKK